MEIQTLLCLDISSPVMENLLIIGYQKTESVQIDQFIMDVHIVLRNVLIVDESNLLIGIYSNQVYIMRTLYLACQ